jgi:hypothetical protein
MRKLTGTQHGDAANALLAFYADKARQLEEMGQCFMAAIALAFGIETAGLARHQRRCVGAVDPLIFLPPEASGA